MAESALRADSTLYPTLTHGIIINKKTKLFQFDPMQLNCFSIAKTIMILRH